MSRDMERPQVNVMVKVRVRTLAALEKQADEEGVTLPVLVRRALDEWLEVNRYRPLIEMNREIPDEPMTWAPTVKISRRARDDLRRRCYNSVNFSVVIPLALDEWLLL